MILPIIISALTGVQWQLSPQLTALDNLKNVSSSCYVKHLVPYFKCLLHKICLLMYVSLLHAVYITNI